MDPLSALSIAAAVIQFVDYSTKVVSKGKELYKSIDGALSENIELETASIRLRSLISNLQDSLRHCQQTQQGSVDPSFQALEAICKGCMEVSKELVTELEKLKVPEGHPQKKWKTFRQALKSVWSKERIKEISDRLVTLKSDLDTHVILSLR
jgi:hypothetical protein